MVVYKRELVYCLSVMLLYHGVSSQEQRSASNTGTPGTSREAEQAHGGVTAGAPHGLRDPQDPSDYSHDQRVNNAAESTKGARERGGGGPCQTRSEFIKSKGNMTQLLYLTASYSFNLLLVSC